jgi:hypothetical protein
MAIDVTITSPLNKGNIKAAALEPLKAAEKQYKYKLYKYKHIIWEPDVMFETFVIEELGALHPKAESVFNHLCELISYRTCKEIAEIKSTYSQELSGIITQYNSRALLKRIPYTDTNA